MYRKSRGSRRISAAAVVLCALAAAIPVVAPAHHSQAMYDMARTTQLTGTVREFQWSNPHCWIQLQVTAADGQTVEWGIEMGNPRQLYRAGWRPGTLKPGDQLKVTINPLRDGARGGQFYAATAADGTPIATATPTAGGAEPGT